MSASYDSALAARAAMQAGTLTSEALVLTCLERVEAREPAVGAWSHLDREAALAAARACDVSTQRGPLAGLPVAIKDIFDTADMPTTYGSAIYAGHRPQADAAVVALIRRAGGVVMGKTVTTEFAMFTPGKTSNPHDTNHTPGGSSSGSAAAVADRMVPLALGTQTAGSIIRPASFCGVVGYKPSFDWLCPAGMKHVAWTLDTVGVFARCVRDAALLGGVLSGYPLNEAHNDSASRAPRFGLCRTPEWAAADADTQAALAETERRALKAGATITPLTLPKAFNALLDAQRTVMIYEAVRTLAFELDNASDLISDKLKTMLVNGRDISARDYVAAQRTRRICRAQLDTVFADVDALIAPSATGEAPEKREGTGNPVFNSIWTLLGTPCVNVPGLYGGRGLPVGVQVIGPVHADAATLAAATWLQDVLQAN
ncbi:MAG: amidase [Salinisphaera sp.]|jgi:Asp-tRNA(Asn)/Glu-tRNA(Gln) amidotransferase A subunit family amidase|nr:amidase [Salinisphaera sp.]